VPGAVYDLALLDWAATLPRNGDGAVMVPLFGDLKRHRIADARIAALGNELLAQRFVDRDVFQTTELWGIGSTAPYGHRGDLPTLDAVIRAHGGDATPVTRRYEALAETDRSALIAFLKTLVIEP
jgi:cytochrome c peroxidase